MQTLDLANSTRLESFKKIWRAMPFDNYEFMHLKLLKKQLREALHGKDKVDSNSNGNQLNEINKQDSNFVLNVPKDSETQVIRVEKKMEQQEKQFQAPSTPQTPGFDVQALQSGGPQKLQKIVSKDSQKSGVSSSSKVICHENLKLIQNQNSNKFRKTTAERHQRQAIYPNGEDGPEQVSDCDTIMSMTNIPHINPV